jgi:hypothetical protein
MEPECPRPHLSRISTPWALLRQAHAGSEPAAVTAQRVLLQRYSGAAYRYLRGALHDEDAALDLFQEFVLRFLRGDFRRAQPAAGRFEVRPKRGAGRGRGEEIKGVGSRIEVKRGRITS